MNINLEDVEDLYGSMAQLFISVVMMVEIDINQILILYVLFLQI